VGLGEEPKSEEDRRVKGKVPLLTYDEFLRGCEQSSEKAYEKVIGARRTASAPASRETVLVGPSQAVYLLPDLRLRDHVSPPVAPRKSEIPHQMIDTETWLEKKP
jgi:hypothetical protein